MVTQNKTIICNQFLITSNDLRFVEILEIAAIRVQPLRQFWQFESSGFTELLSGAVFLQDFGGVVEPLLAQFMPGLK